MSLGIDKIDINILYFLYTTKKLSALYSAKINDIQDYFKDGEALAYYTFVRRVQKLIEYGYILDGYKNSNAKTYFISQQGIDFLENEIISKEQVYENVEEENDVNNKEDN